VNVITLPELSKESLQQLDKIRDSHPIATVRRRAATIYFKALGYPHREIEKLVGISSTTLTTILKMYREGGFEKILEYKSKPRRHSELESHKEAILAELTNNPTSTLKEASHKIYEITGIKRSRFRISKFLKKLGFKPLKTGSLPAKAEPLAQVEFKKKNWTLS
jgi:transposase